LRVKAPARQHQEAIWGLHQTVSNLRSVLLAFYRLAAKAFPKLQHYAATAVLVTAPTPAGALRLTYGRIEAIFHGVGRGNDPFLVREVRADLRAPALRQSEPVETALGIAVTGLLKIVDPMREAVEELEQALTTELARQPLAPILQSAPGIGAVLAARVLAEIGDDLDRFTTAAGLRAFGRNSTCYPCVRTLALCGSPEGSQQAARRRLPLVGLRSADEIARRPRPHSKKRQTGSTGGHPPRAATGVRDGLTAVRACPPSA